MSSNLDPLGVTLIGDTLHDAEVARELGCKCVLVAAGHQSEKRLRISGFPVVASLKETIPIIEDNLRSL
jgi:phosphoglycolate phosphatase